MSSQLQGGADSGQQGFSGCVLLLKYLEEEWKGCRTGNQAADTVVIICFADEQSWAQEVEKGTRGHSQ